MAAINIRIKKAEPADLPAAHRLMEEFASFQKTPEKFTITLEQMLADRGEFNCWLAWDDDNNIVGITTFFYAYYSWIGRSLYIDDIYVPEPYRGMGIGNKIFDALIEIGKAANCRKLRWQVSRWNSKAIEFYQKRGAEIDTIDINCDLLL